MTCGCDDLHGGRFCQWAFIERSVRLQLSEFAVFGEPQVQCETRVKYACVQYVVTVAVLFNQITPCV